MSVFKMRPSNVLAKLRRGETALSVKLNLDGTRAAEIAAMSGFDCLWTCMEHTPNDLSLIERQILAAKAYRMDIMCRVSRGGYSDYIRPLELDATGIMVPHIMSLDDARRVVRMTRFQPLGLRPVDGGNADGAYCQVPFVEYLQQANRERFIALQIEDPEPLDELDAIAALPGYDILFFGPADFSHAIGAPGQWDHPRITDARRRVVAAARKHGKWAGTTGGPDNFKGLIKQGYRFINVGADVLGLTAYFSDLAKDCGLDKQTKSKTSRGN